MDVELVDVSIRFGDFTAVQPTKLKVEAGEFFSILGPSGCGKTTILRLISGFLNPTSGDIRIGGQSMLGVGPHKRPTALIFQNLALFPLMKVWENVAFGLEMRGWNKAKRRQKSQELLDLVALGDQGEKMPNELSGGQRQRVAVARALAVEPSVLLLDEPLSALDLKLRQHMRSELRQIQRKTGVTFIYITHDQGEALTMSDRIAVMNAGFIEQVGTTDSVYNAPATAFAATFVGANNVFQGRIIERTEGRAVIASNYGSLHGTNPQNLAVGSEAILFVRPEKMQILSGNKSADNRIDVEFQRRDLEGPFVNLFFRRGDHDFSVHLTNVDVAAQDPGHRCAIGFALQDAMILPHGEMADD
jgi:spermidine/putrescine transport system ATP-binding protein